MLESAVLKNLGDARLIHEDANSCSSLHLRLFVHEFSCFSGFQPFCDKPLGMTWSNNVSHLIQDSELS